MKKERKEKIRKLIDATFNNVSELDELLKKSDYNWAEKNSESDDGDNCDLAYSILNLGDNLIDWGKTFRN